MSISSIWPPCFYGHYDFPFCSAWKCSVSWKLISKFKHNLSICSPLQAYSTMEKHTCLIRENTSNLLLSNSSREPFQIDKGQASFSKMTTLGAGNMALATPAPLSEEDHTTTKRKTRDLRAQTPEEQVCLSFEVYQVIWIFVITLRWHVHPSWDNVYILSGSAILSG